MMGEDWGLAWPWALGLVLLSLAGFGWMWLKGRAVSGVNKPQRLYALGFALMLGLLGLAIAGVSGQKGETKPQLNPVHWVLMLDVNRLTPQALKPLKAALMAREEAWALVLFQQKGSAGQAFIYQAFNRDAQLREWYWDGLSPDLMPEMDLADERFSAPAAEQALALARQLSAEQPFVAWAGWGEFKSASLEQAVQGVNLEASVFESGAVQAFIEQLDQNQPFPVASARVQQGGEWLHQGYGLAWLLLPLSLLFFRRGVFVWLLLVGAGLQTPDAYANRWQTPDQVAADLYAQREYRLAAQVFENPSWKALAWARVQAWEEVVALLETAEHPRDRFNLGVAYAQLGQLTKAKAVFEALVVQGAEMEAARENLELMVYLLEKSSDAPRYQAISSEPVKAPDQSPGLDREIPPQIALEDFGPTLNELLNREGRDLATQAQFDPETQPIEAFFAREMQLGFDFTTYVQKSFWLTKMQSRAAE